MILKKDPKVLEKRKKLIKERLERASFEISLMSSEELNDLDDKVNRRGKYADLNELT